MPVCPHPSCSCVRSYGTVESLIEHVRSAPWSALYFCDKCRCVCRDETTLKNHTKRVHGISALMPEQVPVLTGPAACSRCGRTYPTVSALQQHYRDSPVHPNCARCYLGFADNAALSQHVVATHHPIACELCNGLHVYREDVASHYRVSPNHPTCPTCNVGFENQDAFERHIVSVHPELRCRICDRSFGSAALLEEHYRDSVEHPKCPECQISFVDERELIKHVLTVFNPLIRDSGRLTVRGTLSARSSPIPSSSKMMIPSQHASPRASSLPPQPAGVEQWAKESLVTAPPADDPPVISLNATRISPPPSSNTRPTSRFTPDSAASVKAKIVEPSVKPSDRVSIVNLIGSPHKLASPVPTRPAPFFSARAPQMTAHWPNSQAKASSDRSSDDDDRSSSAVRTPFPVEDAVAADPVVHGSPTQHDLPSSVHARIAASPPRELKRAPSSRGPSTPRPLGPIGTLGPGLPPFNPSHARSPFRTRLEADPVSTPGKYQVPLVGIVDHGVSYQHPPSVGLLHTPLAPSSLHDAHMSPASSSHMHFPPRTQPASHHVSSASRPPHTPASDTNDSAKYVSHVYCRMCRRDPCVQPTATMCGHIFCNSCIFPEVMKTSQCPVCEAPTLLYALFRLHVD